MDHFSPNQVPTYHVEHLATFSTITPQHENITPRMALQRLFKMEKTSGIWTQRMAIQLKANHMWILDGETNDVVERFPVALIQQPTSFNDQNHIYNNILIFTVQLPSEPQGELHIFQCVSDEAVNVTDDIFRWMRHYGMPGGSPAGASADKITPASNVNVKEAVTVFNQIAAERQKKGASSDSIHRIVPDRVALQDLDSRSDSSSFAETGNNNRNHEIGEGYSNERYVSILNHSFDDIERFIIRLQHAAAAMRELQIRSHKRGAKGGSGDGLLAIRARGPTEEEFFEILSKFKLAFNLLAKLKGCIHDPNAPELVHFLFTPLAIIIEAARSNEPPVDPSLVGVPYLNGEAIELLSNCCTSKEFDLWQSLGINWIQSVKPFRMSNPYQPVFTDGWAPNITEPELIGIMGSTSDSEIESDEHQMRPHGMGPSNSKRDFSRAGHFEDSDEYEDNNMGNVPHRGSPSASHPARMANASPSPLESLERESPHQDNGLDPEQLDWLAELQSRNGKIVRVLFPRTANNNKELSVVRGEILEILDDSRKWWKARNSRGQIAHVPHTIVGEIEPGNAMASGHLHKDQAANDDWIRRERQDSRRSRLNHKAQKSATMVSIIVPSNNNNTNSKSDENDHKNCFEKELNRTVKDRQMMRSKSQDNFMGKFAEKSPEDFTSVDLVDILLHKDFPDRIVTFVEKQSATNPQFAKTILEGSSKQNLRNLIPPEEADDGHIQRLYSNLLIVKNTMKPPVDSELKSALNRRSMQISTS